MVTWTVCLSLLIVASAIAGYPLEHQDSTHPKELSSELNKNQVDSFDFAPRDKPNEFIKILQPTTDNERSKRDAVEEREEVSSPATSPEGEDVISKSETTPSSSADAAKDETGSAETPTENDSWRLSGSNVIICIAGLVFVGVLVLIGGYLYKNINI